jgi:nicotinamide mononucleotide transporter
MPISTLVEIAATAAGLLYVIFMIRENIICWPFGIVGSLLSVYLFIDSKLYSEAFLYSYYVIAGAWGWLYWHRRNDGAGNPIVRYTLPNHLLLMVACSAAAIAMGSVFASLTDAQRPYIDAFTTIFSFAATWMQIKKVLETWLYWLAINIVSIWLYQDRELDIYAALIGVYAVLSVVGLINWLRVYRNQGIGNSTGVAAL